MDEYISKQRAKDLMGCCIASAKANLKVETSIFKKAEYESIIKTIESMIDVVGAVEAADVQPVDRWISVDDKLPDSDTTVLVWYTADSLFGRFGDYGVTHYRESSGWSKASLIGDDQAIFYWMPLPEPPKEGDADA